MKKMNIKKSISVITAAALILGSFLLPAASTTALAKGGSSVQKDDTNVKNDDLDDVEVFGNYTFKLPDSWEDCVSYEDDESDAIYYFIEEEDDIPMFMVLKESLLDYVSSSELKTLTEEDEYEILDYFREGVTEGEDFENLTESTETKIAGIALRKL